MSPNIILTRGTITSTWYDVSLTRDKFFNFFKDFKKINKKIQKKNKKNSKNPEADMWYPI